jgi:FkbM family methyltransferase
LPAEDRVKAAAYVAVLPAEEQQPGLCSNDQRQGITAYIAERGWELAGVYEDVGIAARPARLPELQRLLADLSGLDKLVIAELRRLGKWPRRTAAILEHLQSENVDLVALDYELDTATESGRLVGKLISELAEGQWWDWRPENLRKPDFEPATVIDVGAGEGTLPLYQAFPDAHHVLIEPLTEYEEALRQLTAQRGGEYLLTAVGAQEGSITIDADRMNPDRSSMLSRVGAGGGAEHLERREVPITTLDGLREQRDWQPPFGLKIDTEGFEDEVIRGATALLEETQFVIAEISVRKRFEHSYSFAEFIALMDVRGFALGDVLMANRPAREQALRYVDGVFWPDQSASP